MCGIIGIAGTDKGNKKSLMKKMLEIIEHRGPDGNGVYNNDNITLGHVRLSIIDLEGGQQPLYNEDRSVCIVFNGEIYNYKELKQILVEKNIKFKTNSDTEVILKGFLLEGKKFLNKLNGIFSFAIYNSKTNKIFLARDHFGVKPLYYYYGNNTLVFSSEQKAILLHPEVKREIDFELLHIHINLRYVQSEKTFFKGIKQLKPGHFLEYDLINHINIEPYYILEPVIQQNMSELDALNGTNYFLKQAVKRQLVSDVPIGVYLSGGIDSSAIVQKISELGVENINTFTLGFNQPTDELVEAKSIAKHFNTNHHEMSLNFKPLEKFPEVIWHAEQPKINLLQGFNMSSFVQNKVKVVLGGLGGDELFAGYDIYSFINPSNSLHSIIPKWLYNFMQWKSKMLFKIQHKSSLMNYDEYRRGMQMILSIGNIQKYYLIIRNVWEMDSEMYNSIYSPKFINNLSSKHLVWKEFLPFFEKVKNFDALDQVLFTEFHTKMVNDYLLVDDRMSMAHGIEERVPFLDKDLVHFAFSMPLKHKIKNGTKKYILKTAMKPFLPPKILKKKKSGFAVNPYLQFKKDLKDVSQKILTKEFVDKQGVFNYNYIQLILNSEPHKNKRWHYNLLWVMTGFAIMQKMFIESDDFINKEFNLENYFN